MIWTVGEGRRGEEGWGKGGREGLVKYVHSTAVYVPYNSP